MSSTTEALSVPGIGARLVGFGSIFGKSLRESARAVALVGVGIGLLVFFVSSLLATEFSTAQSRAEIAAQATQLPVIFRGLLGDPINVETMGGFISWRILNIGPLIVGIWSLMALSGTIGGEAARGSLEILMVEPVSRARIALQKLAAHLVGMTIAMLLVALLTWAGTLAFATLPGDEVALVDTLAQMLWLGGMALAGGAVAFAFGPILGRGGAAGVAAAFLVGGYIVNGYAEAVPLLQALKPLSPFAWTAGHRPMAGVSDWPSLALLAAFVTVVCGLGVLAFARRDLGRTVALGIRLPPVAAAVAGAGTRSFFERVPAALWWGIGLGLYVAVFASSAREMADTLASIPGMQRYVQAFFPGVDIGSVSGILQLVVFNLGTLMMAMVAATLVSGWSSDETERRLEIVLAAPIGRLHWSLASGIGVFAALLVTNLCFAAGIVVGAGAAGENATAAGVGVLVAGLYGAAMGGIGMAVGGLGWPRLAGAATGGVALAFFLLDLLGPALKLPGWLVDLAPARHLGQPMAGAYDVVGITVVAVIALGGYLLGAWGLSRRDLRG